jgi:hypothetical protein
MTEDVVPMLSNIKEDGLNTQFSEESLHDDFAVLGE